MFVKLKTSEISENCDLQLRMSMKSEEKLAPLTLVFPDCSLWLGWLQTCCAPESSRLSHMGWHHPWHWPFSLPCCVLESSCGPVHIEHCGVGQSMRGDMKGKIAGLAPGVLLYDLVVTPLQSPLLESYWLSLSKPMALSLPWDAFSSVPISFCLILVLSCPCLPLFPPPPPIMMRHPWISFLSFLQVGG